LQSGVINAALEWIGSFEGRNLLDHLDDAAAEFRVGDPG
jgi:hypothetical protein